MLVLGSMSAFSMSPRCAKAEVQKENLGLVMSLLNKNGVKYSVTTRRYAGYTVIAKANKMRSKYMDNSIVNLVRSPMMRNLGIQFRKLDMRRCQELKMKKDISEI